MKPIFILCFLLGIFSLAQVRGQKWDQAELKRLSEEKFPAALEELRELLSIPNDANYPGHVQQNVKYTIAAFKNRGFEIHKLETGGPPIIVAERNIDENLKTVLFYVQVDGQPVDTSRWFQESPYIPVIKNMEGGKWSEVPWEDVKGEIDEEWRIFARSASDAKGPIAMFLAALDILAEQNTVPAFNIKVILDYEEEMGSPHLPEAVEKYKDVLKADQLVILDGPRHISNQPSLTFGARGITTITLTVFGPRVPQHSGHYGNYVPNPALKLAKLLASMKDDFGKVTIPGYYDGIEISEATKKILSQVPDDEAEINRKLGIAESDRVAPTYQESIQYPSLNIRGMSSGWVKKEVRTIIPGFAIAEIDIRLVPESNSDYLVSLVKNHIEKQGFHFVDGEPTDDERQKYANLISFIYANSYKAFRTEYDTDIGIWLNNAMIRAFGKEPIRKRISGGSIPIAPFISTLGIPAVTVPTVNADNNQHSPNENLRLGNLKEGIRTCLAILTQK